MLVVGPQLLGHTVFNTLMSSVPAHVVSITVLAEPVVATVLAWWLLNLATGAATTRVARGRSVRSKGGRSLIRH